MPVDPQLASAAADLLVMKLRIRDEVSDEEAAVLRDSISEIRDYGPGRTIVRSGVTLTESNLLFDGLVCRFKDMLDGERQIMELHVAGDFVDLHSFVLKRIEHNIGSLTAARFAIVPHEALRRITEGWPHLARLLWFSTLLDSAIHREKIITVGRRSASARIAHLFCELYLRLQTVGLAADLRYHLPLTQADLADASGLTSVHVNRMLKELRDAGLVTFRGSEVVIHDWEGLQQAAEFSPSYLYLERRER
ncbi:MAG: Crp/Fnr family transcriptional regulator [Alphaproteobacteria bacterium]|nr:MAG: Crp/Fnr family transcriptional regulator [Alphaproteobacteria bacterium]